MYSQHLLLQKLVTQTHSAIASHGPPVKVSIKWSFSKDELIGPKRFQNLINKAWIDKSKKRWMMVSIKTKI